MYSDQMTPTVRFVNNYIKDVLRGDNVHGVDHANRVRNWAIKIAKSEKYPEIELVEVLALLHDVGFSETNKWKEHAKLGQKIAVRFLTKNNLLTPKKILLLGLSIKNHSSRVKSRSMLLHILRDADMLDMIGAVGIMRTFISQHQRPAYDKNHKGVLWKSSYKDAYKAYDPELGAGRTIVDQLNFQMHCMKEMLTKYARKIASRHCNFMAQFILQLGKELDLNQQNEN